ncbi:hypothetical protein GCM10027594_28640 [Hymenobacter agri]
MAAFKIGDTVCLKADTMRMWILAITETHALCLWPDRATQKEYPLSALEPNRFEPSRLNVRNTL